MEQQTLTENKALTFLKEQVGRHAEQSPSPLMRWLNPVMLSVQEGEVEFEYEVRPEMTNPIGILHGGITAAIIDDAIGCAVFSFGEKHFYSTINNTIDYLGAAQQGEKIIAKTRIIKKGKQLINAECEVWSTRTNRMIAKGASNLLKTQIEKQAF